MPIERSLHFTFFFFLWQALSLNLGIGVSAKSVAPNPRIALSLYPQTWVIDINLNTWYYIVAADAKGSYAFMTHI